MKQWQKLIREITRTPGPIRVQLFLLTTLTVSSVLSTGLQIYKLASSTSDGSTSSSIESLEVADANGRAKVTGKHTTEVLKNLQKTGNFWGITSSNERSSASNQQQEK